MECPNARSYAIPHNNTRYVHIDCIECSARHTRSMIYECSLSTGYVLKTIYVVHSHRTVVDIDVDNDGVGDDDDAVDDTVTVATSDDG